MAPGTYDNAGAAAAVKGLPLALTGAAAATRYAGGTASGAPTTGTFAVGDFVIDQSGSTWVCTVAGTPGTWVQGSGGGGSFTGGTITGNLAIDRSGVAASATVLPFKVTGAFSPPPANDKLLAAFLGADRGDGSGKPMALTISHSNCGLQTAGHILVSNDFGSNQITPQFPNASRFMLAANSDLGVTADDASNIASFVPVGGVDHLRCVFFGSSATAYQFRIRADGRLDQLYTASTGANVDLASFATNDANVTASSEASISLWRYVSGSDKRGGQIVAINVGQATGSRSDLVFRATTQTSGVQAEVLRLGGDLTVTVPDQATLNVGASKVQLLKFATSKAITVADGVTLVLGTTSGIQIGTSAAQKIGFFGATPIVQDVQTTDIRQVLIDFGFLASGGVTPLNLNGGVLTASGVSIGTTPAVAGAIRLSNNTYMTGRNAANSADINVVGLDATGQVSLAPAGGNTTIGGWVVMAEGMKIRFGTTTGNTIADSASQKIGIWGAAPVVRQSAFTQTYATATKTHAARTATAVATTSSTTTTPFGYTTQAQADDIVTELNALRADHLNTAQVLNALIDDLQLIGWSA